MWYVVSESGDVQSTASHEGSCDTESTKENIDMETTAAGATGGKGIEEIACELVTTAIHSAVIELQHEVTKLFKLCMKLLEYTFAKAGEDIESTVSTETKEVPGDLSVVGSAIAGVSGLGSLQFSDILQKDAFLVFRSLCKLSMKNISNETDPR